MSTFADLGISSDIIRALDELGFTEPTPVQVQVIPLVLNNKVDIVSLAQTGTGKTAAFGLPLVQLINPSKRHTQALVLCPTRELCMQVAKDVESFSLFQKDINVLAVYGGASIEQQMRELRKGIQIIVATPGRLKDLLNRGRVDLSSVGYVVFDEADEMLQMGFQEELNAIVAHLPKEKNTLLFSATMSKEVAEIAARYMHEPVEITVGTRNAGSENISHEYYLVHPRDRYLALKRILDNSPDNYSIIFCRTRMDTQEVADKLIEDGYRADALHGDLTQSQRDLVMKKFHSRHLQLLVATDVAARGLDVNDLTHVINYNLPDDTAGYTHRSGRTGRAGRTGISVALVDPRELYKVRQIEQRIKRSFRQGTIPTGQDICKKQLVNLIDRISGATVNHEQIDPLYEQVAQQLEHLDREQLIRKIVSLEFNRFLKYYKDAPDLRPPAKTAAAENTRAGAGGNKRSPQKFATTTNQGFTRFQLNVGRRNGILPENLISTINDTPGGGRIKLGKIEIQRNAATLEGDSRFIPQILHAFQHATINGTQVNIKVLQENHGASSNANPTFRREKRKGFNPRLRKG
jgi:ATP-dependent RNA helicase DeaD